MEEYTDYLKRIRQLDPDTREKLWKCTGCGEYYTKEGSIIHHESVKDDRFYNIVGEIRCDCYKEEREGRFWKNNKCEIYYYYLPNNKGCVSITRNTTITFYSTINKIESDYKLIDENTFMEVYKETLENINSKLL